MKQGERKALGRGLGALLPAAGRAGSGAQYLDCPIDRIALPEDQPRVHFDEAKLKELAASIRSSGILQPLVVVRDGDRYRLIAGERRLRAARLAGLRRVPAVVKDVSPDDLFELALVENIQREDLDAIEEARAYARLVEQHGYSQEELARRVGKSRSTVANAMRLLQLDEAAQRSVSEGAISAGHARALLSVEDERARAELHDAIVREGLSVRDAERRAREQRPAGDTTARKTTERTPRSRPLSPLHEIVAREIGDSLDAPVEVLPRSRRSGRVVITYDSLESLRRIHARITGAPPAQDHE